MLAPGGLVAIDPLLCEGAPVWDVAVCAASPHRVRPLHDAAEIARRLRIDDTVACGWAWAVWVSERKGVPPNA